MNQFANKYVLPYMGCQLSLFVSSERGDVFQDRKEFLSSEVINAEEVLGKGKPSRYISSRAFLRHTLGLMVGSDWSKTPISLAPLGKPYVPALAGQLWFSLSHTKNIMCVAFSRKIDIGVDIESVRRIVPDALRNIAFSEAEKQEAMSCSDSNTELLHYWVAKEAVLKCIGCGMNYDLKSIHVERGDSGIAWAKDVSVSCSSPRYFRLLSLPCIEGFIGYVAVPVCASMLPTSRKQVIEKSQYQWRLE